MLVGPTLLGLLVTAVMQAFLVMFGGASVAAAAALQGISLGLTLACGCIVVALAPSSPRRKTLSFVWMAVYVVIRILGIWWMYTDPRSRVFDSPIYTVMSIVGLITPAVTIGWWLTLRGRRPRAYWTLLVPAVLGLPLSYLQARLWSFIMLADVPTSQVAWIVGPVFSIISGLIMWGSAWLAALIDSRAREVVPDRAGPDLR